MSNRPVLLAVLFCLVLASPAAAQTRERQSSGAQSGPAPTSPFLGGVPSGTLSPEPLTLTVVDAITRALEHNLGVLAAEEALGKARGTRWQSLSHLMPNVDGRVAESRQKLNLAAFGFGSATGPSFPGVPDVVGPFNVFDARVYVTQSVFDLGAINDAREDAHLVEAAQLTHRGARDFVVHVAGNAFIQALAAAARADAARAQLATAKTLYTQAVNARESGIVAGIDVLRAQVQQSTQQQRATVSANEFEKSKLVLARVMGLPLGQAFALDGNLPELPYPDLTLDEAVERAYRTRPDYQAAVERVRAAESARAAVIGSALPAARVAADVGGIGLTAADAKATYTLVASVTVPIFNGGRTRGRLAEADADLRARQTETEDLKASIYYELRGAFLDLQSTTDQLAVATTARDLAARQLTQARDRFAAGVASNIEVVQAQEAVALASEQYIAAQYGYALAKGALVRGTGTTEDALRALIGGSRR
jgi:outer membrane protein TolC